MQSNNKIVLWLVILLGFGSLVGCTHKKRSVQYQALPTMIRQTSEMRGVWLTTAYGLDWPASATRDIPSKAYRIALQKKALVDKLDNLVKIGINTIIFQAKPDGTVLYRSALLQWSDVLTGTIGEDPGYDPLAFLLQEAHRRCLKVHVWLNPYRIAMNARPATVSLLDASLQRFPASLYMLHKDWIRIAGCHFVLDPGLPEVRNWIVSVITELVKNYPVDGIQFDDYFYHETPDSGFDDSMTYRRYGSNFATKADWRRHNTLLMIKQVSQAIKSLNAQVVFGVSPAGVWRNKVADPSGSATEGCTPAYDTAYADTRQWVQLGLLDYIAPQLYWPFEREIVRYDILANWWANVVRHTSTKLYIGVALYKVGNPTKIEPQWGEAYGVAELTRQLDLNDALPEVSGTLLFSESYLNQPQTAAAVNSLKHRWAPHHVNH